MYYELSLSICLSFYCSTSIDLISSSQNLSFSMFLSYRSRDRYLIWFFESESFGRESLCQALHNLHKNMQNLYPQKGWLKNLRNISFHPNIETEVLKRLEVKLYLVDWNFEHCSIINFLLTIYILKNSISVYLAFSVSVLQGSVEIKKLSFKSLKRLPIFLKSLNR